MKRLILGLGATLCFAGCGDPAPPADIAPLEVVAKPDACGLNRGSVAPGTHPLSVIFEGGTGTVRILKAGRAVLTVDEAGTAAHSDVRLEAGEYVVECVVEGSELTTTLTVRSAPASSGY